MEIALWTKPDRVDKPDAQGRIYRKPKGAVCVAITSERIRAKWVEIVADLIRPERRGGACGFNFAATVQAVWKKEWLEAFRAMERGEISPDDAWATMVEDLPDLGEDPRGEVPLADTWLWSDYERKVFYLCRLDLEEPEIARKIEYIREGKPYVGYANGVDYQTALGLSPGELSNIENTDLIVHPKLTVALAANKVVPVCSPEDIIQIQGAFDG